MHCMKNMHRSWKPQLQGRLIVFCLRANDKRANPSVPSSLQSSWQDKKWKRRWVNVSLIDCVGGS